MPAPGVGVYSTADALLDVARGFLDTAPQDRSGEDRTLVVVQVSAEQLGDVRAQRRPTETFPLGRLMRTPMAGVTLFLP